MKSILRRGPVMAAGVLVAFAIAGAFSSAASAAVSHHVAGTCATPGGCGLYLHSSPGIGAPRIALMNEGDEFDVICWGLSDNVLGDTVWLQGIWRGETGWASDYYVDTHWTTTQDLTNQGMPPCSSGGGDGGGGGGGGGSEPPPVSTSAQWQVTGPQLSYNLFLGSPYAISFTIKNVGTAAGTFAITDSDPACTGPSHPASLQPGETTPTPWRFVCTQKWNWIAPWSDSAWQLAFDQVNGPTSTALTIKDFLAHAADLVSKVHAALQTLHVPSLVTNSLLGLDDAAKVIDTIGNGYTFIEDRRDVLLITQNKNWRPTFTSNFGYSAPIPGIPTQLSVPVSVPSYKWDAYTSFTRTEISAIAFDLGALVTGQIEGKTKNPLVKAALFAASTTMAWLAGRGHDTAKQAYIAAYDPATDYQAAPAVSYTATTYLDALPDGPMKDWAIAYSRALDVDVARDEAVIRYAGAVEAQDSVAQAVQLDALQQFTTQEQSLLDSNPQGEQQLLSTLPADLTTGDQQAAIDALAAPDFASSPVGQAMIAGGASADEVVGLARDASHALTPGEATDLQTAVAGGLNQQSGILLDSAIDTSLRLGDTAATLGHPVAVVTLDRSPADDGLYHGAVTATLGSDPNAAPAEHLEYSLDGGAFTHYTAPLVISDAGPHTLAARAVAADGTVQDPATRMPVPIAPEHSPPVAEIANPYVAVDTGHGLPAVASLDGSPSHSLNGETLTYAWTFDDPGGATDNAAAAIATHTFTHYGVFNAHLTVSNGFFTSTADASIDVVDATPPNLTAPSDASITAGPNASQKIAAWLASATASDDDPGGSVTVTNDYAGNATVGNPVTVTWTATDAAGNTAHASATLTLLDGTPPVIKPILSGTVGNAGWYTSDVTVAWDVSDGESAVSSQSGCETTTISTDTTGTTLTCTSTSTGGTSSQSVTLKRDTTAPAIKPSLSPAANRTDWNNSDVTATFDCSDAGSDVASCPTPVVFHAGASQSATVTATDKAGNSTSYTVSGVNVDETAPTLSGKPTSPPNTNGWYSDDVTIHWSCTDDLSGIAGSCPADSTISGEGKTATATASVSDLAGNTTAAASDAVKIDRTPPLTTASAPSGWSNAGVTVTLRATDDLSGVDATYASLDGGPVQIGSTVSISDEGIHSLAYWSVDRAGNVELQRTVSVRIDKTAPTITHTASPLPNLAGWNPGDVTVSFQCLDSLSGIAFCTPAQLLSGEGRAIPVIGTATDNAGNEAHETALVSIDRTPPAITVTADRSGNANGWYNADVVASFTCSDDLSGVLACPAPVTISEGKAQSVTRSAADVAGNTASATLGGINVDKTAPSVSYTGNASSYAVDQDINITCTATDALSGVASTTCANITGPAWSFGLGGASRSASATDRAGNLGTSSVTFTVGVTCGSLKNLINRFVSDAGVATSLTAKIDAICSAPNSTSKAGKLGAFDNQIDAQTGKSVTSDRAPLLKQFAAAL